MDANMIPMCRPCFAGDTKSVLHVFVKFERARKYFDDFGLFLLHMDICQKGKGEGGCSISLKTKKDKSLEFITENSQSSYLEIGSRAYSA